MYVSGGSIFFDLIAGIIFIIIVGVCCCSDNDSSSNTTTKNTTTTQKRNQNTYNNAYIAYSSRECPSCGAPGYDGYCEECGYPDINQGWLGENY